MNTYSAPYLHIHRADYHRVLVEEARRLGVEIRLNSNVTGVNFAKPAVQFGDGTELEADLVIGADGLKSVTREALLGRKDPPRLTGDLAYRIIVKVSDMRQHPNLLPLIETPAINYWLGPDSHVVGYRMKGGDLYNIVLCCPDTLPEMVNTQKADVEEMRGIFGSWDPRLKELLGLVTETTKWRLQNSEEMDIWSAKEGTFALLGDACHATLPYLYVPLSPFSQQQN
jgi:salicylate hydroxylase